MMVLYVKGNCEFCQEAIQYVDPTEIIYIEEDIPTSSYLTFSATKNKEKGMLLNYKIPFDRIPAVPALYHPNLEAMIIGGSVVVAIVAGWKKFEEVIGGVKINCKSCGKSVFFHSSHLCHDCQKNENINQ